jgi:hypothetical protein
MNSSPSLDLDMCLQLPPNTKLADEGDDTGALAMAKLAELFGKGGMKDVNTDRLTARIPIVMFTCPRPMASEDQDRSHDGIQRFHAESLGMSQHIVAAYILSDPSRDSSAGLHH